MPDLFLAGDQVLAVHLIKDSEAKGPARAVGVLVLEHHREPGQWKAGREPLSVEAVASSHQQTLGKFDFLAHIVLACEHRAVAREIGSDGLLAGGSSLANSDDFPVS